MVGIPAAKPAEYFPVYERLLAPFADEPITLLEIGVYQGGSMRLWRSLLPKARIIGVDPALWQFQGRCKGFELVRGTVPRCLPQLVKRGPFDVVVDDGTHVWAHQQAAFEALWPHTRRLYVIEDTVTSSRPGTEWAVGRNTVEWLQELPEKVTFYGDMAVIER
jgi:hypothetical protein